MNIFSGRAFSASPSAYRPLSAFKTQKINDVLKTNGRRAAAITDPKPKPCDTNNATFAT